MPYELNAVNRGMYIADNLEFLKSLNDECIDLVCIDPPFAKNETFGRRNARAADPLKPPLTEQERQVELDLLARWGIHNEREANDAGIDWPRNPLQGFLVVGKTTSTKNGLPASSRTTSPSRS